MKLDPCGVSEEQFIEIFQKKAQFLGRLLVIFHPGSRQIMEEKIAWEMFQECVYAAEAEAQKISNSEDKCDLSASVFVSREEMMQEIKSVNNKVDTLIDYMSKWQIKQ